MRSRWEQLGLGWASVERPHAHARLAEALRCWHQLDDELQRALIELVLEGVQPSCDAANRLARASMLGGSVVRYVPTYAGAGAVALSRVGQSLEERERAAVVAWYDRDRKVPDVYVPTQAPLRGVPIRPLVRAALFVPRGGRGVASTVRGWGVARLLQLQQDSLVAA